MIVDRISETAQFNHTLNSWDALIQQKSANSTIHLSLSVWYNNDTFGLNCKKLMCKNVVSSVHRLFFLFSCFSCGLTVKIMNSCSSEKTGMFCYLIVYIYRIYFRVVWIGVGEVFISSTSSKNTVKSLDYTPSFTFSKTGFSGRLILAPRLCLVPTLKRLAV